MRKIAYSGQGTADRKTRSADSVRYTLSARHSSAGGYLMLLSLVFGAIFLGLLGALSSFVILQNRLQDQKDAQSRAFGIAEAGLEYYRWFLAHYPGNVQNGTGSNGPFTLPYYDPEGAQLGSYTLTLNANSACGAVSSVDIQSKGWAADMPNVTKTITARYAQPSVATYSYILNDSVWAGADRIILGPYHSNGGIRMDGSANSSVTSSVSTWRCDSNYGCSPTQAAAPGVVGSGPNQSLWNYPVPQVDFPAIAADFTALRTVASTTGIYYPRYSSGTDTSNANYWRGYHLTFNANGTVTVRRVSATTALQVQNLNAADDSIGTTDRALIATEAVYQTKTIPTGCGLIFIEDHVWIDGVIPSKVTVVAANPSAALSPNIYLRNNISYAATDGSDGLTAIAEHNVLIAPNAPDTMSLKGVFIAQDGAFGRNLYLNNGRTDCHSTYEPLDTLTILGTTVSNKRTGTKWMNGCGSGDDAGFNSRIDSYDEQMALNPPPFTPSVSTDYQLMDWREK